MKKDMKNRILSWGMLAGALLPVACATDVLDATDGGGDKEAGVAFNVTMAQDEAAKYATANPTTRAAFAEGLSLQGLTPEDLTVRQLPVEGHSDLCLVETTEPGLPLTFSMPTDDMPTDDMPTEGTTRGYVAKKISGEFVTSGYRGDSPGTISATPWFDSKATRSIGKLKDEYYWSWAQPYARFYAARCHTIGSDVTPKLLSDGRGGAPYIDFEVATKCNDQVDLLTACSGLVHYATRNVAPKTKLSFRHALTAVRFKVGDNLDWNFPIIEVEIVGAKSKGRYTLPSDEHGTGAKWTDVSTPATFTSGGIFAWVNQPNAVIMGREDDHTNFLMIPQNLTGQGVSVRFWFSVEAGGGLRHSITIPLSGEWKAGTTKTYALTEKSVHMDHVLTVTAPNSIAYNETESDQYTVQSYRRAAGMLLPVAWKVTGYDANEDGYFSMDEKPSWLEGLSCESGKGSYSLSLAERGKAIVRPIDADAVALDPSHEIMKKAKPLGTAGAPYDLSTRGGTVPRTTANCYIISAPGHYKLPLVYGNAITNGQKNEHAYRTKNQGEYILSNFVDHTGEEITDPWITRTNGGEYIATEAKLVTADLKGIVKNLKITGSGEDAYLSFEVPAEAIGKGNAVVSASSMDDILWSWHLWFVPEGTLSTFANTNPRGQTYHILKQPLGMVSFDTGDINSKPRSVRVRVEQTGGEAIRRQSAEFTITQNGLSRKINTHAAYYQFGRKDPLILPSYLKHGEKKVYGEDHSIADWIAEPWTYFTVNLLYANKETFNLYHYFNLWSMDNDGTKMEYENKKIIKTIYDPSPAGYKVAPEAAFIGLKKVNEYIPKKPNVLEECVTRTYRSKSSGNNDTITFPALYWYNSTPVDVRNKYFRAYTCHQFWTNKLEYVGGLDFYYDDLLCKKNNIVPTLTPTRNGQLVYVVKE